MTKIKLSLAAAIIFGALSLAACSPASSETSSSEEAWSTPTPITFNEPTKIEGSSLYVNKVENLTKDFIMGMDASSVIAEEASGVKYYDFDGKEADVFKVLSDSGVNYIRVRVWNNPYDEKGNGYGGGNNDIEKAIEIGKRATKYGMRLLVDFHYSDFWADPSKQMVPKAWKKLRVTAKSEALYEYTKECLIKLAKNGVDVGMVQIGNETNNGNMAGETGFYSTSKLMKKGAEAVREVYPKAKVAVHFANPEKADNMLGWAKSLKEYDVDYDVFGSSYYPYWHGTLNNLSTVLSTIAETYNKEVMVMETSYAYTTENTDFHGNTIGESGYDQKDYPFTVAGQANHIRELTNTLVNKTKNAIGACYWEGTWISVGTTSWEENHQKWEKYGSGWASSYAGDYDPDDAGQYYGGCAVENQAFFDENGKPLESLRVFNLMHFGNETTKYIDGVEELSVTHYTYEDFTLPAQINVIYNDNSRSPVDVTWESFDIAAAKKRGNGKYDINGTIADGTKVTLHLTIMERSFLTNGGFEDGVLTPWVVTNLSDVAFDDNSYTGKLSTENPQTDKYNFNWWSSKANTAKMELTQTVSELAKGKYKFQVSIMGGGNGSATADASVQNIYAFAKVGETVYKLSGTITSYGNWSDILVENIIVPAGVTEMTVGIHIETTEAGAWGSVDDCMLNLVIEENE